MAFARFARPQWWGFRRRGPIPWQILGAVGAGDSHSPGAANRGIAGIGGLELGIDRFRDFGKGHPLRQIFPQRVRMLARPVCRLHWPSFPMLLVVPSERPPIPRPLISDIQKSKSSLILIIGIAITSETRK